MVFEKRTATMSTAISKQVFGVLAAVLFMLASVAMAQTLVTATADVPFDFWAAGQSFRAGNYVFDSGFPASISIRREGAKASVALAIIPYGDPVNRDHAQLLFAHRNGKYYLVELWGVLDKRVLTGEFEHRGENSKAWRTVPLIYR